MKTVKDVSEITGISIRTLRYYDEIGLLTPTKLTDAGYRLYDNAALEKLQRILFFKELDLSLNDIKNIMQRNSHDNKDSLIHQKKLLIKKRNRLNSIIELIDDIMEGVNTMSFEAFKEDNIAQIFNHIVENMPKKLLENEIEKYGSLENFRDKFFSNLYDEKIINQLTKIYGSTEKITKTALQSNNINELIQLQEENHLIYLQFMTAKETFDEALAFQAVERLSVCYKRMFNVNNAKNMLLDLAKEFISNEAISKATDNQYGIGCAKFIAKNINEYYGV